MIEKILATLVAAAEKAGNLQISTAIVQGQIQAPVGMRNDRLAIKLPDSPVTVDKIAITSINLVEGDVSTMVHQDFIEDAPLRQFHEAQVDRANAIVNRNLGLLKDLYLALKSEIGTPADRPAQTPPTEAAGGTGAA